MDLIALFRIMRVVLTILFLVCAYLSLVGIFTFRSKNSDARRKKHLKRYGEFGTKYAEKSLSFFISSAIGSALCLGFIYLTLHENSVFPRGSFPNNLFRSGLLLGILVCGFIGIKSFLKNVPWMLSELNKIKR